MALRFHNTLSGEREVFEPLEPGRVRLYTCGPTVHDRAHLGNFRTFLFEDVLRRFLEYSGYRVTQVMNITDVEDRIIRKAREAGVSIGEYTEGYTRRFFEDLDRLGLERAEHYPRATRYIEEMVRLILQLRERGHTYERDGSTYFRIATFPGYGKLSKIDLSGSIDGVRIDADEYDKEDPKDFVLWKAAKPGEDHWDTVLGPGRPGWHIECSAMSMALLGESFDIHTGGVDNVFPHHENEIAQSESATGKPFARYWLHAQHLSLGEEKMAKRLGNFVTLEDLLNEGHDPLAVRYLLISAHYRSPLQFTEEGLGQAGAALGRLRDFAARVRQLAGSSPTNGGSGEEGTGRLRPPPGPASPVRDGAPPVSHAPGAPALQPGRGTRPASRPDSSEEPAGSMLRTAEEAFREALEDDLNTPRALAAIFNLVREANAFLDRQPRPAAARLFGEALGRWDRVLGVLGPAQPETPGEVVELVREREEARSRRDFARSDEIRRLLAARGFAVEDTPEGPRVKVIPHP